MSSPIIEGLAIDDDNESKFWVHGVTADEVLQVLDASHTIKKNRKDRRASHLIIGRDGQGRCLAVPVEPTRERTIWRPVTAWPCKPHEAAWLP